MNKDDMMQLGSLMLAKDVQYPLEEVRPTKQLDATRNQ